MRNIPFFIFIFIILTGCASNFATSYKSIATVNNPLYVPANKPIEIIEVENISLESKRLLEDGYMIMGISEFVARTGSQNIKSVERQAVSVGAQVAIVNRKRLGETTIAMPITTPTTSTSTTNYNLYGSYGSQVLGSAKTTTHSTQTQYIPVTLSSTKYSAYFFGKFKNKTGIYPFELDDSDKLKIEQNFGVKVGAIVRGSPAYISGILANDIILKVNKKDIYGIQGFIEITSPLQDESLDIDVYRNGKTIRKVLRIDK